MMVRTLKNSAIFCTIGFLLSGSAFAQNDDQNKDHEKHHPKQESAQSPEDPNKMQGGGMMGGNSGMMGGSMNMDMMMDMMKGCMDMHNNMKMCNNDVMKKCQESKDKSECKNMMKDTKKNMNMGSKNKP